ncbi:MAG TPA: hypothetical protein DD730_09160 [Desulfosporosinus sp.]|jgi:inner membrane protein|nr:hypothetical protein [Desulfosporosinus sp.]
MTGKTHIAIGFLAVMLGTKIIDTALIKTFPKLVLNNDLKAIVVIQLVALGLAVWLGSLAPDLDQPGSTLSRDLGGPMGTTKVGALVGGLGLLYLSSHLPAILRSVPYIAVGFIIIGCILLMKCVLKHRGMTHSLLGMTLAGAAVNWGLLSLSEMGVTFAPTLLLPFLIGYGAHLAADSFTNSGIAPFYVPFVPMTQKHWHWPLSITTGTFVDTVVLRFGAIVLIAVNFVH